MVITLTPEIETVLSRLAMKQGTTVELLALRKLRELLSVREVTSKTDKRDKAETLADLLTGYIGVFDSSEFVRGGAQMSSDTGESLLTFCSGKDGRDACDSD